ncbi:hypothetical protein YC2023_068204 [Brassica napus]
MQFHLLRHVFAELGTNSIRIKRQTLASDHADEQSVISQSSGRSTILKIYSARITAATSLHTVAATGVFLVPWGPEDLREKMWSDFKVVKMWSDLKKKMSSLPEGVKMLSDLGDKACSELKGEDVV